MHVIYMPISWGGWGGQCRHIYSIHAYMECLGMFLTQSGPTPGPFWHAMEQLRCCRPCLYSLFRLLLDLVWSFMAHQSWPTLLLSGATRLLHHSDAPPLPPPHHCQVGPSTSVATVSDIHGAAAPTATHGPRSSASGPFFGPHRSPRTDGGSMAGEGRTTRSH